MTDAALWSLFLTLLLAAAYVAWPRPPTWDLATFHHMVLATLHRGALEREGKDLDAWKAALATYLPAGPRAPSGGWTEDPALLGGDYDPVTRLGARQSWDTVADQTAAEAVSTRLREVVLLWVGTPALPIPGVRTEVQDEPDFAAIPALLGGPHVRLVLASSGPATSVLEALRAAPMVRDQLRAVLLVGAEFDPAWLETNFTTLAFDSEQDRTVPWLVLRRSDAPEALLAEPPASTSGFRPVAVVDLGRADDAALAHPFLGQSLAITLAALG